MKVYLAHAMTGRSGKEVLSESEQALQVLSKYGIEVLDPVIAEGVKASQDSICASYGVLDGYWRRDKEMIREAHALIDLTPERKSEGVAHEIGYARYALWKKVVRVYPKGQIPSNLSVAVFEDDYITDSLEEAARDLLRSHGNLFKRLGWRFRLLNRCLVKWLTYQLKEFK